MIRQHLRGLFVSPTQIALSVGFSVSTRIQQEGLMGWHPR